MMLKKTKEEFFDIDPPEYQAHRRASIIHKFGLMLVPARGEIIETIASHDLLRINPHPGGFSISLICYHSAALLLGKNLLDTYRDMQNRKCVCVWEYDRERWPEPPDASAPIVRKMKFYKSALIPAADLDAASGEHQRRLVS
jgi:hypothetical protein